MSQKMISIAHEYSETPAGRYREDGPFSGQRFREELLVPALQQNEAVEVNLDGVVGFGSSFLEEAFGGLVRAGYRAADLRSRLQIKTSLATYQSRIWRYIEDAGRTARRTASV